MRKVLFLFLSVQGPAGTLETPGTEDTSIEDPSSGDKQRLFCILLCGGVTSLKSALLFVIAYPFSQSL
jgi:hypothetical protein